jgi:hypothetical protein
MTLDDTQKKRVTAWIDEGLKLSEIQKRIETELGLRMTYMELRFLVDELKVMPKDVDPPKIPTLPTPPPAVPATPPPGGIAVSVDTVTRPGALVSGSVTFSDGQTATWYLDQTGRLGVMPQQQGYKPSQADVQAFQTELQVELQKLGL